MTVALSAFIIGFAVAAAVIRPEKARHARRTAGWAMFRASVADALLLFDLKGVYSQGKAGSSNPATTGESPHQICT